MRVAWLDVLREHEHCHVGVLCADALRRHKPLVGMGRRHADVGNRHVRTLQSHLPQKALGVLGLGYHFDSGFLEQPHDPLAGEHHVIGHHYSHGISARRVVSPTSSEPASAPTRSAR